ncbi:hypothetical protein AA103196_1114 [Ameyamaea chiangmaiensis NBRC 103196]|nr:hypothetical protein AA103196_1114 [Ameyamaea chiangmaiensis NBRC 103196]
MRHIRRVLNETNAMKETLERSNTGEAGEIRLGFYLPPFNSFLTKLLLEWRAAHPGVCVTPYESGDRSLHAALTDCQIDAALVPDFCSIIMKLALSSFPNPLWQ